MVPRNITSQIKQRYSIIIPTLNEEKHLLKCLESIQATKVPVEVIVVDGGSRDKTARIAQERGVLFIRTARGRGGQLNEGAKRAKGNILIFLHADTTLPEDAFMILEVWLQNRNNEVGTFTLSFDHHHWLLNFYSRMTSIDSLWTRFGDQCIVVRKTFFDKIKGFPHWPLFEDVHFLQVARKKTKIHSFPASVNTSADKFIKNGIFRQQLHNGWLILQYLMGVSPQILYEKYNA